MNTNLILLSVSLCIALVSAQSATGFLDTATPDSASGWACIPTQPWRTLTIQIYVDGRLAGNAIANQRRESAVGQQCGGNPYHGFIFNFREEFRELLSNGGSHTVRAFVQPYFPYFQRIELNNSPRTVYGYFPTPTNYPPSSSPRGFLDTATSYNVAGWACDPDNYNQYLQINLYIDGQYIASTTANQPRESAVGDQCGGNSYHGFTYNWNSYAQGILNDGNTHTVAAYAINYPTGSNFQLSGSPKTVVGTRIFPTNFPPPPYGGQAPKGYLDEATTSYAAGWACDLDNPDQPIQVQVFANNQFLGQTTANLQRESAVGQQCGGYSNRGWRISFPYYVSPGTQISAYAVNYPTGGNTQLNNSPRSAQ